MLYYQSSKEVVYIYKIGDVKKQLVKFQVKISVDNIRKLANVGIVKFTRGNNKYRYFSEQDFKRTVANVFFYYFNTPIDILKSEDIKVIRPYVKKAIRIANKLLKEYA